jgi:hypothetical protein
MTRTRSDRLIALGAVDAGWPEPALCLTGSVSFANRHGNGERTHLCAACLREAEEQQR